MNRSGALQRVLVIAAAPAACFALALAGYAAQAAGADESRVPATHVLSLLESSCLDCHDADTAEGNLVIPALGTEG